MVKWCNVESIFVGTNGEMATSEYGEMLILYDDLNVSIWFGGEMVILFFYCFPNWIFDRQNQLISHMKHG